VSRVEELEYQIKALSSAELQQLRVWLAEYEADLWDQQFDADVAACKLDAIAEQALKDHLQGRSTEL
jgi:hypothetical protein